MVSASSWFRLAALARRVSAARASGMATTVPNAWISWACCPVSGAALGTTFVGLDLLIFGCEGLEVAWTLIAGSPVALSRTEVPFEAVAGRQRSLSPSEYRKVH